MSFTGATEPSMRAVVITRAGGPEVLEVREVPRPAPGAHEVLVRVRTSALNRADVLQRRGRYPAPPGAPPDIPGLEFAGEVAALAPGVRKWREGDRVFGIAAGGAHADYIVAHEEMLAPVPPALGWIEAGAVPEAFMTAHDALTTQGNVWPGEHVLIHAVGSGVGLAAVQVASVLGALPYGTTRTPEKLAAARAVGLEDGIVLGDDLTPLAERVAHWTEGAGVQVVLDLVGGPYVPASIGVMGERGRLVLIGTIAGGRAEIPLGVVLGKRLTLRGTVLRSRSLPEKSDVTRTFAQQMVPWLAEGAVRPVVDRVYPLEAVAEAHRYMESNASIGKIVIDLQQGGGP